MKITSIEKLKKSKDKIAVFIDNSYSFTINEEDYISLNLYEDSELNAEQVNSIKDNVLYRAAKSEAVKFIAYKFRSRREVVDKLISEAYDPDTAERVVDELSSMGYINDKIYAQKYIFDRNKLKPRSSKLIRMELEVKGIPGDVISEVLSNYEVDDSVIALNIARKKFSKYDIGDETVKRKIMSFLHHRGFNYEIINQTINDLKHGSE